MARKILFSSIVGLVAMGVTACLNSTVDWVCICEREILGTVYSQEYLLPNQSDQEANKICDYIQQEDGWDRCKVQQL